VRFYAQNSRIDRFSVCVGVVHYMKWQKSISELVM